MFAALLTAGAIVLIASASFAQQAPSSVDQAMLVLERACLAGSRYRLSVEGEGNLVLRRTAPSAQAIFTIDASQARGNPNYTNEQLRLLDDAATRNCMIPYIPQLLKMLDTDGSPHPPEAPPSSCQDGKGRTQNLCRSMFEMPERSMQGAQDYLANEVLKNAAQYYFPGIYEFLPDEEKTLFVKRLKEIITLDSKSFSNHPNTFGMICIDATYTPAAGACTKMNPMVDDMRKCETNAKFDEIDRDIRLGIVDDVARRISIDPTQLSNYSERYKYVRIANYKEKLRYDERLRQSCMTIQGWVYPFELQFRRSHVPEGTEQAELWFNLTGSNTIGSELVPELGQSFLKSRGAQDIQIYSSGDNKRVTVTGTIGKSKKLIVIEPLGTSHGFEALADGRTDLAMASRQIKRNEIKKYMRIDESELGHYENVIAKDGVAIIVNRQNPNDKADLKDVCSLFSGRNHARSMKDPTCDTTNLYKRDSASGTTEIVLERCRSIFSDFAFSDKANTVEDSRDLDDRVSRDSCGIGYVGEAFVANSKALGIFIKDSNGRDLPARRPDIGAIKSNEYALSRNLYLYANPNSRNLGIVRQFVDFIQNIEGQKIVNKKGFVSITVPKTDEWEKFEAGVHFSFNGTDLNGEATRSVKIFSQTLETLARRRDRVDIRLVGHSDEIGSDAACIKVGRDRAQSVKEAIAHGIASAALDKVNFQIVSQGKRIPIDSNETEEGRRRNRRVEMFYR